MQTHELQQPALPKLKQRNHAVRKRSAMCVHDFLSKTCLYSPAEHSGQQTWKETTPNNIQQIKGNTSRQTKDPNNQGTKYVYEKM